MARRCVLIISTIWGIRSLAVEDTMVLASGAALVVAGEPAVVERLVEVILEVTLEVEPEGCFKICLYAFRFKSYAEL